MSVLSSSRVSGVATSSQASNGPSLRESIAKIYNDHSLILGDRMKGIMTLLSKYKAKELPSATELGLPQIDWLEIYYDKMGTERGKPLTYKERSWNIPGESDPSGWSDEVWAEWRD